VKAILIANPKGGSGKTTLSTNIAGYIASRGQRVAILDLDRQKSATQWLATRSPGLASIELMQSEVERESPLEWLVIDSPAGLHGKPRPRTQAGTQGHCSDCAFCIRYPSQPGFPGSAAS